MMATARSFFMPDEVNVSYEILKAESVKMAVCWVVAPCSLYTSTRLHGAASQKVIIILKQPNWNLYYRK
jgi:hypothetical protein